MEGLAVARRAPVVAFGSRLHVGAATFAEDAERLRRFEREAKATAALSHPNILDVHDVGTFEGTSYLVEEL